MRYSINLKYQLKSLNDWIIGNLFILAIMVIVSIYNHLPVNEYPYIIVFVSFLGFITLIPCLYLHIQYYIENNTTAIIIDEHNKKITIENQSTYTKYSFDDIQTVERHLAIGHNKKKQRKKSIWNKYGYLRIKFKDGKTFIITSLMIDIMNPPITVNNTIYRYYLSIDKEKYNYADKRVIIKNESNEKYEHYLEKFKDYSKESLLIKVNNAEKYEPEAIVASKKILFEKHQVLL